MNLSMKQKQNQGHREWTDGCQKGRLWGEGWVESLELADASCYT